MVPSLTLRRWPVNDRGHCIPFCSVLLAILLLDPSSAGTAEKPGPRLDRYGDPLPDGAIARVATGRRLYRFGKPHQSVTPCFSPDGNVLAVYGMDPTIEFYHAATGERLRSLKVHEPRAESFYQVAGVAFTPDGKVLASAGGDG